MLIKRDSERLEEYRLQLRATLNELLSSVDDIMDYCYTRSVAGIHIDIDVSPDKTTPKVSIQTTTLVTDFYKDIAKSKE